MARNFVSHQKTRDVHLSPTITLQKAVLVGTQIHHFTHFISALSAPETGTSTPKLEALKILGALFNTNSRGSLTSDLQVQGLVQTRAPS